MNLPAVRVKRRPSAAMVRRANESERYETAMARLHNMLRPGSTVYTVLRHVARSGMSRHIDVYVISGDVPFWLSGHVSAVLGYRQARDGSLIVNGGGMDMGFDVVYNLSLEMWPDSNPIVGGGYILNQRWL
jgi:hypothetical protein